MTLFNLLCSRDHEFEAWFLSGDAAPVRVDSDA